VQPWASC